MRKFKRIFVILLAIFSVSLIVGCDRLNSVEAKLELTAEKTTINVGEKLSLVGKIIVDEVEILPTEIEYKSSADTILLVSKPGVVEGVSAGTATITASVVYEEETLEAKLDFTVLAREEVLGAPANLKIENKLLTWSSVSGATSYVVEISGTKHNVEQTSFDLSDDLLEYGNYEIKVYAKKADKISSPAIITFSHIDPELENSIYIETLKLIDPTYEPDLELADFGYLFDYEEYLTYSTIAKGFAKGAASSHLSLADSQEVFTYVLGLEYYQPQDLEDLKIELDKITNLNLDSTQLSNIVYEVFLGVIDIQVRNEEKNLTFYEEEINELELEIEEIKTNSIYLQIMAGINKYTSAEERVIIDDFFEAADVYSHGIWFIQDIYWALVENDNYQLDYYKMSEEEIEIVFFNLMSRAYAEADLEFLNNLLDNSYIFDSIFRIYHRINEYNFYLEEVQSNIDSLNQMKNLAIGNKQVFLTSLDTTFAFIYKFNNQMDLSIIENLMDLSDGTLSTAEIFIFKSELVSLFKETLPTEKDFENMYLALILIMNQTLEINPVEMVGFSQSLGQIQHRTYSLLLNIVNDFSIDSYNELMLILDGLYTPGDGDPYDYVEPEYDARKVVELIVYLGNYINEIEQKYGSELNQLSALQSIKFEEQIYLILEKSISKMNIGEAQHMFTIFINNYFENPELYKSVTEIFKKYAGLTFDKFIETNGEIAFEIIDFLENGNGIEDLEELANHFELIFEQMLGYVDLTFVQLTEAELDLIVDFSINYSKIVMFNFTSTAEVDLDLLFTNITPALKEIQKTSLKLQLDFLDALEANNAAYEFVILLEKYPEDESLAIQLILALDDVLTIANKNRISNILDLFISDILSDPLLMELNELSIEDIGYLTENINSTFNTLYEYIGRIGSYDFHNLTEAEYLDFKEFKSLFF